MRDFKLSDKFLDEYKNKEVQWGFEDLSYTIFKRSYARHLNEDKNERTEEWWECIKRVVEGVFSIQKGYCKKNNLEWNNARAQRSAQIMYDKIFNFKFTPPGRGLWAMGSPIIDLKGSACLQNCAYTSTKNLNLDATEPFLFMMDMSMLGPGVGFSLYGANKITIEERPEITSTLVVDDSREGWVEALRVTLMSYFGGPRYKIDYSKIRPKGSPIKTFGGIAPGPEPLINLCEKHIPKVLDPLIGEMLDSVTIVDIMNFIGRCVVSGNVRRTAQIALGDPHDEPYIEMKNWKKFKKELNERRKYSNNSVYGYLGMDYKNITEHIIANGEPGIVWMENVAKFGRMVDGELDPDDFRWDHAEGVNPCSEQFLEDEEMCTLVEIYPANHDDEKEFIETLKYAYMYAKTVTLVPTHNPKTNAVMMKNRRIGASISGIEQAITKFGKRRFLQEFCDAGYKEIRRWDRIYSNWLGIPRSIRVTTVKPSGTVSLLTGASPGVHKPIARRYIRYVKWDTSHPYIEIFKKAGYIVEIDETEPTSSYVLFPIEEIKPYRYTEETTNIWEQFQMVSDLQHWWSDNGVSCTIKFDEKEINQIEDCLSTYESRIKAISLLPKAGHMYVQAPYTLVSDNYKKEDRFVGKYKIIWLNKEWEDYKKKINSKLLRKEISKLAITSEGEVGCTNDSCEVKLNNE